MDSIILPGKFRCAAESDGGDHQASNTLGWRVVLDCSVSWHVGIFEHDLVSFTLFQIIDSDLLDGSVAVKRVSRGLSRLEAIVEYELVVDGHASTTDDRDSKLVRAVFFRDDVSRRDEAELVGGDA
jgi:hypothetical protein